jgi:ribonucleoside-diphosphate reductase alpha chain
VSESKSTEMSTFAETIMRQKYLHEGEGSWTDIAYRVVSTVMGPYLPDLVDEMTDYVAARKFMPGGRYLYATGKRFHQVQNCLLMRAGDSREEWADLMQRVTSGLMTGAGVGVVYSDLRGNGAPVEGMGGKSTGPLALMQMVNEAGRHIMQGGSRRAAIWAGLHWNHPDVFDFIAIKDWSDDVRALKEKDFNFPATMDMTNVSVILDDDFFAAIEDESHEMHEWAQRVYWTTVEKMLTTAEPGFSVDVGENNRENLRNACTEVTSEDDDDICNLGSINLARVESLDEMRRITELGTAFLLCGTLYSKVPYERVAQTRKKNRRLGLGLMGLYEWLVVRGYRYEPNLELSDWLNAYAQSDKYARKYADQINNSNLRLGVGEFVSYPLKTRAIAPTGTIGILAETTTGIEPLFATAYKRRYLKGKVWHAQYVVDATAQRLIDKGVDPAQIETAYDLARDPERRIAFQAWVQQYVDHGISSTLNLPSVEEQSFSVEGFGRMLLPYLPKLRGVTCYPDGARGGQPLNVVPYAEAVGWEGVEFEEVGSENACASGVCGV